MAVSLLQGADAHPLDLRVVRGPYRALRAVSRGVLRVLEDFLERDYPWHTGVLLGLCALYFVVRIVQSSFTVSP